MSNENRPAVVLLSGGLDSATVLAIAAADGFGVHALSFDYGQRNVAELHCAADISAALGARGHIVTRIDRRLFGGSALTDDTVAIPHRDRHGPVDADTPVTYVPARNTVFLSLALAYAESIGSSDIFIGISATERNGYPDCRPDYVRAFETMANLGTRRPSSGDRMRIHTPLLYLTKADAVRRGLALGVDFAATLSCFDPVDERGCGTCDACLLRRHAFAAAGVPDPAKA